jgi:thiol-disulfide isomerase/thioredoxin
MDNTPIILSENDIASLKGKHGVVLFYMNGCNPCNMIKPHWNKAIEELKNDVGEEIILGAIERDKLNSFNNHINVNRHVNGFPTILYLHPSNHNSPEVYKGNREHKDIKEWIIEKKNRSSGAKKHIEKKRSNSRGYQGGGGGSRGSSKRRRKSRRRTSKRRSGSRMYRRRKGMRKTKTARMSKRRQSGGGCGCGSSSSNGSIFDFLKSKPKHPQQEQ